MASTKTDTQIVTRKGSRFALVPIAEYRRLKRLEEESLPPYPQPNENGNYPAVEYCTVSIARSFAEERRRLGLTQLELARLAGVRPETIHRREAAKHVPSVATVEKIDRALKETDAGRKRKPRKGRTA
jgi:DNA-binding XRE family transcriptional regulator